MAKIEGKTPKQWLAIAQKAFNEDKQARESKDLLVFTQRQYREGNHWMEYNKTTGELSAAKVTTTQRNQFVPETDRLVDLVSNILTSGDITYWYVPRAMGEGEEAEERAKEVSQKCNDVREYLEDELYLDYKKKESADDALTDGTSYIYVGYDFSACYLDGEGEKVYDGMPTCETRDWFDVYIDCAATSMKDARRVTVCAPRDTEYLKLQFGVEVKPDNKYTSSDYGDFSKQLSSNKLDAKKDTAIVKETWIKHQYKAKTEVEFNGETVKRDIVKYKMVVVKWTDGVSKPLEVLVNPLKDNEFPLVAITPRIQQRSVDGRSLVKALMPMNRQVNEVYSTMLKVLKRFGGEKIVLEKGSGIKKGDLTDETMQILVKNRGASDPKTVTTSPLPEMYPAFLDRVLGMMGDYANAHEALAGGIPPGVTAGKAINVLVEQDQEANSSRKDNFVQGWAVVYYKLLRRVADFWSIEHQISIRGEDGKVRAVDLKPEDVSLATVKAEAMPSIAHTFTSKVEQAKELFQLGLLPRKKMMQILKLGNIGELLIEQEEDAARGLLPQAGGIGGLSPDRMAEGMGSPAAAPPEQLPPDMMEEPDMSQFQNLAAL